MIRKIFGLHRPKGSGSDVKRDERVRDPAQNFRCEMQASRWGSQRSGNLREDRLITRFVFGVALPSHIRRQREEAALLQIDLALEGDDSLPVGQDRFDARAAACDLDRRADFIFRPGFTRHFQRRASRRSRNRNSIFPSSENRRAGSTRVLLRTTSRRIKIAFEVREHSMLDALIIPVQNHHARIFTAWERPMGNEMLRQDEIVIGEPRTHRRNHQRDCRSAQKFRM